MPWIETLHLLPSSLPQYMQSTFALPSPFPHSAIVEMCSMEEPTVVTLKLGSHPLERGTLLVWLPDALPEQLLALARTEPLVENYTSSDLRTHRTFLMWRTSDGGLEVRLDTWDMVHFCPDAELRELRFIFVGPGHAFASTLHMDANEAEAFVCGLQSAASSSGPNWRPWRIYSEEEMLLAEGQPDVTEPGVVVPRVRTLTLRN